MLLAAAVDAGCPLDAVRAAVTACGIGEVTIDVEETSRAGIRGLHLVVHVDGGGPSRTLAQVCDAVGAAGLPPRVTSRALAVLRALGTAEAGLHGVPLDDVHLHELGAADTVVDVVGFCVALEELGVDEVRCSPLPAAPGSVTTEHGELPLPAPATLALLAAAGAPLQPGVAGVEQVTPTAAALLATLARFAPPSMRLRRVGHGAGTRDDPHRPNLVRLWLGDPIGLPGSAEDAESGFDDDCVELRANLDDATPAAVADAVDRCLAAGALDAWVVPAVMKKGRPGHVVHVLAARGDDDALARLLLTTTSSLGVRRTAASRLVAARDVVEMATPYGGVRVKRRLVDGRAVDARPELDDCRRIARAEGRPLQEVVDLLTVHARAALVDAVQQGDRP